MSRHLTKFSLRQGVNRSSKPGERFQFVKDGVRGQRYILRAAIRPYTPPEFEDENEAMEEEEEVSLSVSRAQSEH